MDIHELTQRMHEFVDSQGWYEEGSKRPQSAKNIAASVAVEAAEILELFQWGDEIKDKPALASELADVSLYLLQLASICDIDLEKAILDKLELNSNRRWDEDSQTIKS